jgi:hypothetical protein
VLERTHLVFSYVLFCFLFLQIEEANVFKEAKQFTYKDGVQFVFMDLVWLTVLIIKFVRLQRYLQS